MQRSRASSSGSSVWALVRAAGSAQDAALFLTAAFTGLRMGELLALQWRDVNFSGQAIRVRQSYNIHGGLGTPKSGKVRSVPMVPEVAQALAALVRAGLRPPALPRPAPHVRHPRGPPRRGARGPSWMSDANIQTTMRYVPHRDRGDQATLLAQAFALPDLPAMPDPRQSV